MSTVPKMNWNLSQVVGFYAIYVSFHVSLKYSDEFVKKCSNCLPWQMGLIDLNSTWLKVQWAITKGWLTLNWFLLIICLKKLKIIFKTYFSKFYIVEFFKEHFAFCFSSLLQLTLLSVTIYRFILIISEIESAKIFFPGLGNFEPREPGNQCSNFRWVEICWSAFGFWHNYNGWVYSSDQFT